MSNKKNISGAERLQAQEQFGALSVKATGFKRGVPDSPEEPQPLPQAPNTPRKKPAAKKQKTASLNMMIVEMLEVEKKMKSSMAQVQTPCQITTTPFFVSTIPMV